jgi:L-rhamnose mutarotase
LSLQGKQTDSFRDLNGRGQDAAQQVVGSGHEGVGVDGCRHRSYALKRFTIRPRPSLNGEHMPRIAFELRVKPELLDEYVARHAAVWPEMLAEIAAAGRRNYSLFLADGCRLVGYYETDDDEAAQAYLAASPVAARWEAAMSRFFVGSNGQEFEGRADQASAPLREVFHLDDQLSSSASRNSVFHLDGQRRANGADTIVAAAETTPPGIRTIGITVSPPAPAGAGGTTSTTTESSAL